jgi:methionine-rich copper-binding protein CopC
MARRLDRKVLLALGVLALTASCDSSGPGDPTGPGGNPAQSLSITISPDSADVFAGVGSQAYTATVRDAAGNVVTDAPVTWSSTGQASVTSVQGATTTAKGMAAGRGTVTATVGSASRTAVLMVRPSAAPASLGSRTIQVATNGVLSQPAPGLLAGAQLGTPAATLLSFGGGTLGGSVTSYGAGQTATFDVPAGVAGHPMAPAVPAASQAAQGFIVVNADGSFTITPPQGFDGALTFQFRVGNVVGSVDGSVSVGVDAPPSVVSTTPLDGSLAVSPAGSIAIAFSEPVTATASAVRLECPSGANVPFALSGSGTSNLVVTPSAQLPRGASCRVTVVGAQVRDTDADDGPDAMSADHSFAFAVEAAVLPRAVDDQYDVAPGAALNVSAGSGVLSNDTPGLPAATITSFGGGSLGGSVTSNAPGSSVSVAGGTVRLNADGSLSVSGGGGGDAITFRYRLSSPAGTSDASVTVETVEAGGGSGSQDDAPFVLSTTPANNATGVPAGTTISIRFDEPVTATAGSFKLDCPLGAAYAFTVSGSGTDQIVLTPTLPLPGLTTCRVWVIGNGIHDVDPVDPPDRMELDHILSFTVGVAPVPENDGYNTALDTPLLVNAAGVLANDALGTPAAVLASFGGGSLGGTVTTNAAGATAPFGTGSLQLGANGALAFNPPAGFTGVVSFQYRLVNSAGSADGTVTITVDAPPSVTATTPLNGGTDLATNTNVVVTFSEPVALGSSWVTAACASSGVRPTAAFGVSGGPATYTLDPLADFTQGETCTFTVVAAQVTDLDVNDPADQMAANYIFSFTMDAAPAVLSTSPLNGATNVAGNADIVVTFTEPVLVAAPPVFQCTLSGTLTVPANIIPSGGPVTYTLNPIADFQAGETCTGTLQASQVTDLDANDPPNNMLADYNFSFTIDAAPAVLSTSPVNGATNVPANTNLVVTFTEPVFVTAPPVFQCSLSGTLTVPANISASGGPVTYTLDPLNDFQPGETCTGVLLAGNVADLDANDPPNNMLADYNFSFTIDAVAMEASRLEREVWATAPEVPAALSDELGVGLRFASAHHVDSSAALRPALASRRRARRKGGRLVR